MELSAVYVPKQGLHVGALERVELRTPDGKIAFYVMVRKSETLDLTVAELDGLGRHVQDLLAANPYSIERDELKGVTPYWAATPAREPGAPRQRRSSTVAPEGATFLPDGEIVVPPRSKTETPEQKRFRRACRSYRNFQRGQAEATDGGAE